MMRTPRKRMPEPPVPDEDGLPACRNYASLTDTVLHARRRPRASAVLAAGLAVAALILAGGWLLRPDTHSTAHYASLHYAAPRTFGVDAVTAVRSPSAAPSATRVALRVDGRSVVAGRTRIADGVDRILIVPAVPLSHGATLRRAVLGSLVTGLLSPPQVQSAHLRGHAATLERYLTRGGTDMSTLCVQWTADRAYLLTAPTGARFAALLRTFQPR